MESINDILNKGLFGKSNRVNGGRAITQIMKNIKSDEREKRKNFNLRYPKDKWYCNIYIPSESIPDNNDYFENNIFNEKKFMADVNKQLNDTFQYYEMSMSLFYGLFATGEAYTADIGPIWGIYVDYENIKKNAAIYESMIDDIIGNFPGSKRLEGIYAGQKPSNKYQFCKNEININNLISPRTGDEELLKFMKERSIIDINTSLIAYREILN